MSERDIARNRKAFHDYIVLDRVEAGISLLGSEVKSLREGQCNLKDSYALIENGEVLLSNMHIAHYGPAGLFNHDPERKRKLLLHRREIDKLFGKVQQKGLTLIPLRLYWKEGRAKVELGVCQGKKLYDKRQALKEKELEREAKSAMSRKRLD
ncbi:MAG: SsrA-binding protein SmpB [Candidatus Omnitrophica bacterium]|jgi:SsrA-binding protein|nr:MAG: SsrA-binding protein [Candidatus Hinthialibacteria bacterium OLB16]MBE7489210.1 SsrA-binding protein SmpB [bacterium]MCC6733832.1 SsrA-binding protein SmpB [Candidatus Omnitrophota bacterium]MCE7907572.1 SsrA-binding protein SmpB [Candidatus Omnitrophica bacterium COP1]MBV6482851.1 SsrA-binding protein [bacterium]